MLGVSSVCLGIDPETATTSIAASAQITETITVAVVTTSSSKSPPQALPILPQAPRGGASALVSPDDAYGANQKDITVSRTATGSTTAVLVLDSSGQIPQGKSIRIAFSLGGANASGTDYSVKAQPLVGANGESIPITASVEKKGCESGSCKIAVKISFPAGTKIKPGFYQGKISLVINNN
jgi:hypothetical protein